MITIYNVIDIRTGTYYSVAVIDPKNQKYFVVNEVSDNE